MAENNPTNNSLSDIGKQQKGFNTMLSEDKIYENTQSNLEKENSLLEGRQQVSSSDFEKNILNSKITKNKELIETNKIDKPKTNTDKNDIDVNNKSLFDRDAMIDYARYINADENGSVSPNWREYLKNGDKYIVNNERKINEVVPFKDSSLLNNNFSNEGLSIDKLITWSEKYPALQLRYQDFVYCKRLGYYPNNRLIILRRFKGGVPDNLFDYYRRDTSKLKYTQPLATMITWASPDEDFIDSISFNEGWEEHSSSIFETVKAILNNEKAGKTDESMLGDMLTSVLIETLKTPDTTREDGVPYTRAMTGNPNLIKTSKKRIINKSGENSKNGLNSKISFNVSFEYELRFINNIDPSIAMLDLIGNALRMGTSESEFAYNMPYYKDSTLIKAISNGDTAKLGQMMVEDIKKLTDDLTKNLTEMLTSAGKSIKINFETLTKTATDTITKAAGYITSRYREELKAAISSDTGLPSGIWHITYGNPKAPIISCGDLIVNSSSITLGKELGYNDFPNSFTVKYTLDTARERGKNEIIRIFNSGRGRLYVYPQAKDNPDYDLY
jgi:hypothetical protein